MSNAILHLKPLSSKLYFFKILIVVMHFVVLVVFLSWTE